MQINNFNSVNFGNIVRNNLLKGEENKPSLYIISGPSGVGKGTVIKAFNEKYDYFSKVVTCTTRQPRPGEVDGVDYNFITPDEFKKGIKNGEFAEYVNIYGDTFYGTKIADVNDMLKKGKNPLLEINVDGAKEIKSKMDNVRCIFIKPQSINILREHLEKRGTESPEVIQTRLDKAAYEIEAGTDPKRYDIVIQNNNSVEENVNDLAQVLNIEV